MAALADGLRVVWDEVTRIYLCTGYGCAFRAWFAGTPPQVEAELFFSAPGTGEETDVFYLYAPATQWPYVPTEDEVATAFNKRLQEEIARRS